MKKLILDGKKIKCVHEFVDEKRTGYIWAVPVFFLLLVFGVIIEGYVVKTLLDSLPIPAGETLESFAEWTLRLTLIVLFIIPSFVIFMLVGVFFFAYKMASLVCDKTTKNWLKSREQDIRPYLIYEEKMFETFEKARNSFTTSKTAFGDLKVHFDSSSEYNLMMMTKELGYTLLYAKKNFVLIKNGDTEQAVSPWEFRNEKIPNEYTPINEMECFVETSDVDLIKLSNQLRSISKYLFEIKWKKEYPEENFSYIVYQSNKEYRYNTRVSWEDRILGR